MSRDNSFDQLRLLAAIAVVYHHCAPVLGQPPRTLFSTDFGQLGVAVFFVISGYLVTASLERSAGLADYFRRRLLRLEPALIVCLLLTVLLLGPVFTTLPLAAYFASPQTWLLVVRDALLYPVTYELPGVFAANPYPHAVNGPIWTLRLEFSCYLGIAALWRLGWLRPRVVLALAALALAVWIAFRAAFGGLVGIAAQYAFLFLAGAWLHLRRKPVPRWWLASAALAVTPLWVLGIPAAVVILGEARTFRLPADISYGVYLYAFPVQQMLVATGVFSFPLALACTIPLAIASWYLVEKPALRLKEAGARFRRPGESSIAASGLPNERL